MITRGTNPFPGRWKAPGKNCAHQQKRSVENTEKLDETRNWKVGVTGYWCYRALQSKGTRGWCKPYLGEAEVPINICKLLVLFHSFASWSGTACHETLQFCIHISDDHCLLLDLWDRHHFSNVPLKEL